ncbi:MAG: type II and III secretion system protein [Endomicrobium sp.]|jgi:pilus assembly protein CpaC|nr:type II and III secretion system protein [Endomicrobium sp.]
MNDFISKIIILSIFFFSQVLQASEQMVEISVEISEINEDKRKELGIEWPSAILVEESNIPAIIESGSFLRKTNFSATLKALETIGAAKVLSKPKLITKSSTSANFMVGGEFPIVTTGIGTSSVKWKKYGIMMNITPTILNDNKIDIAIETELSRIDNSINVAGYPVVATRQASSRLQIKNGQTIILAGLLETSKEKRKKGIPLLCDIPLLGVLFGTVNYVDRQTNVLIFVTPNLIKNE